MGTVVGVVVVILVVLVVVGKLVGSINKSVQKVQGKNRCAACKSRLKAVNGVYATTCSKCGTKQSWAK